MIELHDIYKTYQMGDVQVRALAGLSLHIAAGELTAIMRNRPSPRNPKSSYMASLSACVEVASAATLFAARAGKS